MEALFNSADSIVSLLENSDTVTSENTENELTDITQFYENLIADQCSIESKYVDF